MDQFHEVLTNSIDFFPLPIHNWNFHESATCSIPPLTPPSSSSSSSSSSSFSSPNPPPQLRPYCWALFSWLLECLLCRKPAPGCRGNQACLSEEGGWSLLSGNIHGRRTQTPATKWKKKIKKYTCKHTLMANSICSQSQHLLLDQKGCIAAARGSVTSLACAWLFHCVVHKF